MTSLPHEGDDDPDHRPPDRAPWHRRALRRHRPGRPLAAVAERALEVDFPDGRQIVRQGEVGTGFFLIASGSADVVRDGRTIARLGPGDFFGELSLLDGQPRIATVVARTPTTCVAIASWEFETVLETQPGLAIAILRGVARRLRAVSEEHRH